MRRWNWGLLLALAFCAAVQGGVILWGWSGHQEATRQRTRADSLATEIILERARADGWEARAADTTSVLLELLTASDSQAARLSRELEAARARPVSRTVVVTSSSGAAEAPRDPEASAADSTVYLVDDGPLSGVITTWADSALARLDWSIEISAELIHVEAPDRRLLVFARSLDPRVRLDIPTLEYQLPPPPPGPGFPWGCVFISAGTGAATAITEDWRVLAAGSLLTVWRCWP